MSTQDFTDSKAAEAQYLSTRRTEGLGAAVRFLKTQRHLWSASPRLEYLYYALSGDLAQELPEPTFRKMRQAAARRLKRFLARATEPDLRKSIRNEIHFHRRQFNRQRLLGFEDLRKGNWKGNFSVGVGAWARAEYLMRRGQALKAYRLALVADRAWAALIANGAKRQDIFGFAGMVKRLLGDDAGAKELFDRCRAACATETVREDYASDEVIVGNFLRCIGLT